ncbi:cation diffusion facilitator family transporter [Lachnotalea glycerini]|uniref:Cation diffusion facilitator family transporter n=1 Tax=Lachnotalea glycerini TaxID=1763509 RepID=A0A255IC05_9FIRM|nr:cation diffusion facilitator family transporter [Lachnotalea glycerini]PXV85298.1 cation diffusion facilitator family transporter [Lachnotalea glycerini]RDY28627.1 cation transporter [Lachnotalea glycerini]
MISLLARIFIKDKENIADAKVRREYGMLSSMVGIFLNILLFIGKYFAGVISGSIAITADAFNNLSDAGSSVITLIGFHFSGKKPDAKHPFGHGRIEYLSGFIVSMAIILVGFELAKSSIAKIISPSPVDTSTVTFIILVFSIVVKLYMSFYNSKLGNKIDSPAMKATATDSLSDSVATLAVLLSVIVMKLTNVEMDGWSGILVAIFILYSGYHAAKDTLSPLLGQVPDCNLVKQIEEMVLAHEEIIGIHDLVIHDYGPGRLMISLHGEVPSNEDIFKLHDAIDCIEMELNRKLGCEAVIHMDPIAIDDTMVFQMRRAVEEKVRVIGEDITIHDFRMVRGSTHTNLIFDAVVPFEFVLSDEEVKKQIEDIIISSWENYIPVVKIDKSYV